ncbi:MAG: EF-P lysine aminoacylase EpmA [Patescibacteria group bacterium]
MRNWQKIENGQLDKNIFIKRAAIIRAIRNFFWQKDFLEVETPELVALPGQEPYLGIIDSEIIDDRGAKYPANLITSPEYAMKKLLAAGYEKIFQITKAFRNNESFGGAHNPEFTILEWYRQKADYLDIMKDTEALIKFITVELGLPDKIIYQDTEIDFSGEWERLSIGAAMKKYAGVGNLSRDGLAAATAEKGYYQVPPLGTRSPSERGVRGLGVVNASNEESYASVFFKIFLNEVETKLPKNRPIFLYDYPAELGALAKRKEKNPEIAERFELYIGGLEIANAFSELLDADEQRKRFLAEQKIRAADGRKVYPLDADLLTALGEIKNPCGGIALGVDRLVMLLTNQKDINDVIFFPASQIFY